MSKKNKKTREKSNDRTNNRYKRSRSARRKSNIRGVPGEIHPEKLAASSKRWIPLPLMDSSQHSERVCIIMRDGVLV